MSDQSRYWDGTQWVTRTTTKYRDGSIRTVDQDKYKNVTSDNTRDRNGRDYGNDRSGSTRWRK